MVSGQDLKYIAKSVARRATPLQLFYMWDQWRGNLNASEANVGKTFHYLRYMFETAGCEIRDRQIIEVGSGRFARLALRLLDAGAARVVLVDLYAAPLDDSRHRKILEQDLQALELDHAILNRIRIIAADASVCSLPELEESADVIFSISALEHVRNPLAIHQRCARWLKPGASAVHSIDFRDHNDFARPFEMLKYSDFVWRFFLDPPGGCHLNRYRLNEHLEAASRAGFEAVKSVVLDADPEALQKIRRGLHPRFSSSSDAELSALAAIFVCSKSPRGAAVDVHWDTTRALNLPSARSRWQ